MAKGILDGRTIKFDGPSITASYRSASLPASTRNLTIEVVDEGTSIGEVLMESLNSEVIDEARSDFLISFYMT